MHLYAAYAARPVQSLTKKTNLFYAIKIDVNAIECILALHTCFVEPLLNSNEKMKKMQRDASICSAPSVCSAPSPELDQKQLTFFICNKKALGSGSFSLGNGHRASGCPRPPGRSWATRVRRELTDGGGGR